MIEAASTGESGGFPSRIHPLDALGAVLRLMRDKEATHEVFNITRALDGPPAERLYQRFIATETGKRVLRERRDLARTLADREMLARLPEGSLGRAYLDFASAEDLSPEGFQAEMDKSDQGIENLEEGRRIYVYRTRHSHDLFHVLTGYGRDLIGELSLLGFTVSQTHSRGLVLVMLFLYFKARAEFPGLPVLACMLEGRRLGREAGDLIAADWEALLALPVEEARRRLRVRAPRRYLGIQAGAAAIDRRYRAELAAMRG